MRLTTSSPPAEYAFERIPTVASAHPLWDEHDEWFDPGDDRILDYARVTPTTTVENAAPRAVAKMADDTIMPLVVSVLLTGMFAALLTKLMWLALFALAAAAIGTGGWLWPEPERTPDGAVA